MLRGELPTRAQFNLLEAALVPGVDHGPHAPSIAISRMTVTCGLPVIGAMASAINVLDDIHGGAGQQCMELYREIDAEAGAEGRSRRGRDRPSSSATAMPARRSSPIRPSLPSGRSALCAAVRAGREGEGGWRGPGRYALIGRAVEVAVKGITKRNVP